MSDSVIVSQHAGWVELTLNRPDKLNSFNDEMHLALRDALSDAAASKARAVLITGAGRGFCAGQDLGDRDPSKMTEAPNLALKLKNFYNPLVRQIRSFEAPVICAVNGVAAGAGETLRWPAILFWPQAVPSSFNPLPKSGGSWMLTRLLGEARATALALTAAPLTAQKAEDWGLIWKSIPADELMIEARKLSSELAAGPTFGLSRTKLAIQSAATNSLDEHLGLETQLQKDCGESADYEEGVSIFLQKRAPEFKGR